LGGGTPKFLTCI